ncbi:MULTISPECIES: S24 family peptidase [Yersinia]|uniref:S24 family peptidase n=1 Tax=Yersinia TaxID=629 RepID=UPI00296D895F|nr:helix-turn-helix transcriptional regulator [Yersinia enterocolitica]
METKDFRRNNLRALMGSFIQEGKTKAQFADAIGLPASQLSQLVSNNATRNVGDIIARRVESNLGLTKGWMDVPHDHSQQIPSTINSGESTAGTRFNLQNLGKNYTDHPYRLELLDTLHSCGGGRVNGDYPEIIQSIEIDPEYAKRMFGSRPANSLKLTTAYGDSMLGTIDPGELVVIDITVKTFRSDGIYAFTYGEGSHIKRLQMLKDKIAVISDNSAYERWEINSENEEDFHIEGFIVGKWQMAYSRLG